MHLSVHSQRQGVWRRFAQALPTHAETQAEERDECRRMQEHPEPHKHLGTTAGSGGQKPVRALGDGHNSR